MNDDAVKRCLDRLDAREDPPAPQPSSPEPLETSTVVRDLRIVVTQHRKGMSARWSWIVRDAAGRELAAREALTDLFLLSAQLIVHSHGWQQEFWRAARGVLDMAERLAKAATPRPRLT